MNRAALRGGAPRAAILLALSGVFGCGEGAEDPKEPPPPFLFVDGTEAAGLHGFRQVNGDPEKPFIVETVGAGVALVDVDQDGDLDAYLTNGGSFEDTAGPPPADALYLNDGEGHFTDGTAAAGLGDERWTNGVRATDVDGDGWPDLYLTNYGPNVLYRNLGEGRFEDVTESAGVGDPRWSTGAAFFDHDRDGDLDLYVANYIEFDEEFMLLHRPRTDYRGISVMKGPRGLPGARDRFYRNEGDGTFADVSAEVGIDEPELFAFQCVVFDVDRDGWLDVYVANDSVANLLWMNVEGKHFEDRALRSGLALSMSGQPQAGMGVAVGDHDGDLMPDVFVTNFADDYFTLYLGKPNGYFRDSTRRLRLAEPTKSMLGWGCDFADFDNDGKVELFAVNGHVYPQVDELDLGARYSQRNQLFETVGDACRIPRGGGGPGFEVEKVSRGSAVGDVDGDGDLDLLIGNLDDIPTLLRNEGPSGRWCEVLLVGADANRDAIGARVVARVGGTEHLFLVGTASGFLSTSQRALHVGLGQARRVDELEVAWPGGAVERFEDLPAESLVVVEERRGDDGAARISIVPWRER